MLIADIEMELNVNLNGEYDTIKYMSTSIRRKLISISLKFE